MFCETCILQIICILDGDTIPNSAEEPYSVVAKCSPPVLLLNQNLLADLQYLAPLYGAISTSHQFVPQHPQESAQAGRAALLGAADQYKLFLPQYKQEAPMAPAGIWRATSCQGTVVEQSFSGQKSGGLVYSLPCPTSNTTYSQVQLALNYILSPDGD